jgi:hypothetical protein
MRRRKRQQNLKMPLLIRREVLTVSQRNGVENDTRKSKITARKVRAKVHANVHLVKKQIKRYVQSARVEVAAGQAQM